MFAVWFDYAVTAYGWLGGNPDAISERAKAHIWDWPKHPVADIGTEADASDKKLKNGTASIASEQVAAGLDPEDELQKTAESNGVTVEQQRQINMLLNLPQHVIPIVAQILKLVPNPTASAFTPPATDTKETPANG
jgi:LysM repeat protein